MLQRSYVVKCHYPLNSVSEKHNKYNKYELGDALKQGKSTIEKKKT
jgi:hypothetical protein